MSLSTIINRLTNQGVSVNIKSTSEVTVALWAQELRTNKSPVFKGFVTIGGVKHKVVLWNNTSDNPSAPQLTGCLDNYQPVGT